MKKPFLVAFCAISLFCFVSGADILYVSPSQTCTGSCTGTQANPFNNVLDAIKQASSSSSATILLMYSSSASHYILDQAYTNGGSGAPSPSDPTAIAEFSIEDLTIKPLLCTEEPAKSDSSLSTQCISSDEKLTVFLKTTKFKLTVTGSLTIQNIEFDAIEDIRTWNTAGDSDLEDCLSNRKRCCDSSQTPSTLYPDTLICDWHNDYSTLSLDVVNSLFVFSDSMTTTGEIQFTDCEFKNFLSPGRSSLVQTGPQPFKLTFDGVTLDRVYFDSGVISYEDSSSVIGSSGGTNSSLIIIQNTVLKNYNDWNMLYQSQTRREGYLFNAQDIFSGTLQITESNFQDSISSLRDTCWDQTTDSYQAPMNNLLQSEPRSRSNLWNQYHQETGTSNDSISSLIYIESLYGAVSVSDSSFTNIIGTSGSILRIDDIISSDTWLTIYSSNFDGTFAYDKFASIMVAKKSDPVFASMLKCPYFEVFNSTFTNSYGCPGAYGNLLYLCYWDSQPSTSTSSSKLSSYSLGSEATSLTTSWTSESPDYTVRILQSTFSDNHLAVSNSLALVGTSSTLLQDNIFKENGGTTAEIAQYTLENSFFLEKYPSAITFPLSLIHFGQASSIIIDRFVQLHSLNNTYQGNFGPWEGSMALASSLTLLNWIKMTEGITSNQDSFKEHEGISSQFLENSLTYSNLIYTEPMISFSVDSDGSNLVATQIPTMPELKDPIQIAFKAFTISHNVASYDISSFAYNTDELSDTINNIMLISNHFETGVFKLLWASEVKDDFSLSFHSDSSVVNNVKFLLQDATIENNELLTSGCLFQNSFSVLKNITITSNQIYLAGETFQESIAVEESYWIAPEDHNAGMFCVGQSDFSGSASLLRFVASSLFVKDNIGILINLFPDSQASGYLSDSIFVNNSCTALSMISVRTSSDFTSINNIFISNFNSLGNIYIYLSAFLNSVSNIHLYSDGKYASLYYMESSYAYECLAKAYWNTLSPTYKVFTDGLIPQSGLYFNSYTFFTAFQSTYEENIGYGGLVVAYGGNTYLQNSEISNHYIVGSSIVGTYLSIANLFINDLFMVNNTIAKDPELPKNRPAVFSLLNANLDANNIFISEGSAEEGATLLFAILTDGQITNMTVNDFYRTDIGQAPLMTLSYSTLDLTNLDFSNTTGVFKLEGGTFSITTSTFQEITNKYNSQFLIYTSDSILTIQDFNYFGNGEYSTLVSLVEGQKNTITATNLHFTNAAGGQSSTIFDLKSSQLFFVSNSIFEYEENSYVTVFTLTSSTNVIIQNSVFVSAGTIINANIIEEGFFFLENTIFTESLVQNMILTSLNSASIFQNHFVNPDSENTTPSSFPDSQVQIINSASVIEVSQNTFYSLYGTNGIVEFSCTSIPYSANMSQNIFIGNEGSNGGAIYLYAKNQTRYATTPEISIDNSVFIQNQALTLDSDEGRGGALHQTTPDMTLQNTWLLSNSFIKNSADGFGGAIYFDYSLPSVDSSCIFEENYASDLNHIGSYPVRLVLIKQNTESSSHRTAYIPGTEIEDYPYIETSKNWKNIGSGVTTDEKFTFALLDMFNQVVYDDNSSLLQIYPEGFTNSQRQTFSSQLSIEASSGLYVLEDFEFTYKVNQKLSVVFKSSAVPSFARLPIPDLETSSDLTVEISFRNCGIGEFSIQVNGFASCEDCPAGFWQVNPDITALACEACDDDAMICRGGNQVGPNYGYWRMNKTADVVMQCPIEEACLGNKVTTESSRLLASTTLDPTGSCADNYQGHLCFDCVDGWAKGTSETCVDCRTSSISYILLFLMIVFKSVIIVFGVREALEFAEKVGKKKHLQIENGILLRAFLNYTQLFALIVGLPVTWPEVLDRVLSISGKASSFSGQIFTIECFYRLGANAFGIETIYLKAIMNFATPFIFLFFATIFWMIYFTAKKMPILRNKDFTEKIIITIVIICFEQQPEIIKEGFALLRCENLYREDSPIRFLVDAYDIQCWEGLHLGWSLGLVLPTLFIWIILLPGTLFYILTKNRKQLDEDRISKKYSFIYNGYKKEKYYWEAVILIRKIIFISNMVFTPSLNLSIYLSLVFILCSYTLHIATHPYSTHHLNKLERVGLVSLGIVNLCGLYFQIVEGSVGLDILVIIAGLIGNLYFFVYFASLFFALQLMKLKKNPKVIKILKIIDQKLCCCRHIPIIKRGLERTKIMIEAVSRYIPTIKLEYIKRKTTLVTFEHQSPKLKKQNSAAYKFVCEDEKNNHQASPDNINIELTIAANKYESDDQQQHIPFESLDSVSLPKFVGSPFNNNRQLSMSEDEGLITLGPSVFSVRSNRKLLTGIDEPPPASSVRSMLASQRNPPQPQVGTIKITEIHNSEEHDDGDDENFEIPSLMVVSPDGLSEVDPKDFNERCTEDYKVNNN